jgi:nucleotide-binding universal stress UspA family protein
MRILLPVDGSEHSERVARYVIQLAKNSIACEVVLLNVQPPIDAPEVLGHMPQREIEAMQETRGGDALVSTRALLDAAGVSHEPMVVLGRPGRRNHRPASPPSARATSSCLAGKVQASWPPR